MCGASHKLTRAFFKPQPERTTSGLMRPERAAFGGGARYAPLRNGAACGLQISS
jgi:hypothetical protein